jgi:ABC-type lipoprotein release transport system permease subunit
VASARLVRALLFGVDAIEPPALVLAPAVLIAMSIVAYVVPAWRASTVDITDALLSETALR